MTTQTVPSGEQPDHFAEVAAELHRVADDIGGLAGRSLPKPYFCIDLHPHGVDDDAIVAGVDAIAGALLGKPGKTYPLSGGGYHHGTRGSRGPIDVSVYDAVSDPKQRIRDAELEQLRAEVAELRAKVPAGALPGDTGLAYTRADTEADDPTPVSPARVPLHTGSVVDGDRLVTDDAVPPAGVQRVAGGHQVHECCGKLDDGPHRTFCALYAPPPKPGAGDRLARDRSDAVVAQILGRAPGSEPRR